MVTAFLCRHSKFAMMQHSPTTPFGRRSLSLVHVVANAEAKAAANANPVHKWQVFRDICAAKSLLGLSERALAVLDALLSFHPEIALTGEGLVVFPSNRQLCLRAHGMAEATLRRHVASLADAGLIVRRDSPNGKRYARKDGSGEITEAFGFDLAPIVARAEELAGLAKRVRDEDFAMRLARERVTLCRRDISKMIALGIEEGIPEEWQSYHNLYRTIMQRLPRNARRGQVEATADNLTLLAQELQNRLEDLVKVVKVSGSADQNERHKQNSKPEDKPESEPRLSDVPASTSKLTTDNSSRACAFPLGMVLDACPDLLDYVRNGLDTWRDFVATASAIRPMLGISASAWEDAVDAMGEKDAAVVVACILQRASVIGSAGGYLRELTRRRKAGEFTIGPMVMALLSQKRGKLKA